MPRAGFECRVKSGLRQLWLILVRHIVYGIKLGMVIIALFPSASTAPANRRLSRCNNGADFGYAFFDRMAAIGPLDCLLHELQVMLFHESFSDIPSGSADIVLYVVATRNAREGMGVTQNGVLRSREGDRNESGRLHNIQKYGSAGRI